jgi:hypothetical protein
MVVSIAAPILLRHADGYDDRLRREPWSRSPSTRVKEDA